MKDGMYQNVDFGKDVAKRRKKYRKGQLVIIPFAAVVIPLMLLVSKSLWLTISISVIILGSVLAEFVVDKSGRAYIEMDDEGVTGYFAGGENGDKHRRNYTKLKWSDIKDWGYIGINTAMGFTPPDESQGMTGRYVEEEHMYDVYVLGDGYPQEKLPDNSVENWLYFSTEVLSEKERHSVASKNGLFKPHIISVYFSIDDYMRAKEYMAKANENK